MSDMLIELVPLDTRHPPTWDGTTIITEDEQVFDDSSALRATVGDDKVNYKTFHRTEGDLFERDLINFSNLKALVNYLLGRGGFMVNLPATVVAPGKAISMGDFPIMTAAFPAWYVIGAGAQILYGASASGEKSQCGVRVANRTSTVSTFGTKVLECSCAQQAVWTISGTNKVPTSTESGLDIYAYNELNGADNDVVISGWAILMPKVTS